MDTHSQLHSRRCLELHLIPFGVGYSSSGLALLMKVMLHLIPMWGRIPGACRRTPEPCVASHPYVGTDTRQWTRCPQSFPVASHPHTGTDTFFRVSAYCWSLALHLIPMWGRIPIRAGQITRDAEVASHPYVGSDITERLLLHRLFKDTSHPCSGTFFSS